MCVYIGKGPLHPSNHGYYVVFHPIGPYVMTGWKQILRGVRRGWGSVRLGGWGGLENQQHDPTHFALVISSLCVSQHNENPALTVVQLRVEGQRLMVSESTDNVKQSIGQQNQSMGACFYVEVMYDQN